jgi:phage portal protein BeeE
LVGGVRFELALTPGYSGAPSLKPNIDDIPALSIEQDTLWARLEKTSFLTDDEKRAAIGYGPLPPQQKFNPGQLRKPSGKPGGGE